MGKKQRRSIAEAIAAVPESEPRVILATGSYIGEGFDDARLDTLFLAMPISWKGTLQQYVGRLHRLHDAKRVVRVYDYVDSNVSHAGENVCATIEGLQCHRLPDLRYSLCSVLEEARNRPPACEKNAISRWRMEEYDAEEHSKPVWSTWIFAS